MASPAEGHQGRGWPGGRAWQSCLPLDAGRGGPGTATPVSVTIMSWELQPERDRCRGGEGGGGPAGCRDHAESCYGARVWERQGRELLYRERRQQWGSYLGGETGRVTREGQRAGGRQLPWGKFSHPSPCPPPQPTLPPALHCSFPPRDLADALTFSAFLPPTTHDPPGP